MNLPGKLIANNGAEFKWDDYSFDCNETLTKEQKKHLRYSDNTDFECWGNSSDLSYRGLKDTIVYNIGIMFKNYPETKEQFFEYVINYTQKGEYD